ncbi:hypothetical protein niasHT_030431 [Heterodera trifolii]|uniref:Uncharacterized protein n=1 Tax=Heterodera trifolii TaxID=157864 RepID=A0ABD2I8T5_9BILA
MFCANGNPTVLSTTLAKALKATLAVGGRAAWKALTQKDGIFDGLSEQIKEQPEMLAPFFPLTFGIAGGEILVEQEKFNMDYIFNLFERMTGRDQLNKICFVEAEESIFSFIHLLDMTPLLLSLRRRGIAVGAAFDTSKRMTAAGDGAPHPPPAPAVVLNTLRTHIANVTVYFGVLAIKLW